MARTRSRLTWAVGAAGIAIIVIIGVVAAQLGDGSGATDPAGFDLPARRATA